MVKKVKVTPVNVDTEKKPVVVKERKRRRRKQMKTEIKRLRRSCAPIIPLSFFKRTFHELAPHLRVQKTALNALREAVEREGHGLFEASLAIMESSKKHSITKAHLQAATNVPTLRLGNA